MSIPVWLVRFTDNSDQNPTPIYKSIGNQDRKIDYLLSGESEN